MSMKKFGESFDPEKVTCIHSRAGIDRRTLGPPRNTLAVW